MLIIVAPLDAPEAVQDVVVRVVNMAGEGAEGQRTTTLDERLDLVGILEVTRGKKPRLILILAEVALEREVLAAPTEGERIVQLLDTRIGEEVLRRRAVTRIGVGELRTPSERRQEGQGALKLRYLGEATAVGGEARRQRPLQATPTIGERTLPEDDDAREGFGAMRYRFGALDDVDLVVGVDADLGSVVVAPLLARLADAIIDDEHTRAVHAVDDGLRCRRARLQARDAADLGEEGGEVAPEVTLDALGRDLRGDDVGGDGTAVADDLHRREVAVLRAQTQGEGAGGAAELVQRDEAFVIADEMDVQAVLLAPREGEGQLALEVGLHGATADVADGAWERLSSSIVEDLDDEATALGMRRAGTQDKGEEHPQR